MPSIATVSALPGSRRIRPARLLSVVLAGVLVAGSVGLAAETASGAKLKKCAAHSGTLAKDSASRVWHRTTSLYSCSQYGTFKPRTTKLGKWVQGTRVYLSSIDVAWITPRTKNGIKSDRVSARNMITGKSYIAYKPLVPASGSSPARDERLQSLKNNYGVLAWTTRKGDIVMANPNPADDPTAVSTLPGMLPGPLSPQGNRLLVASYSDFSAAKLAASLRLAQVGDGDGDECDTIDDYQLSFTNPGGLKTGALWPVDYSNPACSG